MKTLILMLVMVASSVAFTADEKLPKATEPIVAELNAAKAKATGEAIKKLQKVQADLTKKNDLDGAMATKKYIEELQKSLEQGQASESDGGGIIGKWGDGNETRWEFKADGIGLMNNGRMFKWEKDAKIPNVFNLSQLPGPDRTVTLKTQKLLVEFVPSTKETHDLWKMK